ncbi:MAG: carboxypeptidase regulatory-like domain-containing protein [Thiogranum sp.]|nr:carboxypeptidase regulatory-like domain-containing protein [Thiogranum sp.]
MATNQLNPWKLLCVLLLTGAPVAVWSAGAPRSLEVHVLNRQSGEVIAGAAVCVGTAAKLDQFGARRTNSDGIARFEDIPPNALLITASKRGVQGAQQFLEPVAQNRVVIVKVASGGGGPECNAPAAEPMATSGAGLKIERVTVSDAPAGGSAGVLLSLKVSGKANEVRASETSDFAGADWQAFRSPLPFTVSPGKGEKQLYVQVRHHVQAEGAVIEVVSPVERVRYRR